MPEPFDNAQQSFFSHLGELRTRLMRALSALALVFGILAWYDGEIFELLARPLLRLLPTGSHLVATDVTASFMAPLRLSFLVSLFVIMPYILFELWGFIAPALYREEKRVALPLLIISCLLFYAGVAFSYVVILPTVLHFFTHAAPHDVQLMTDINHYINFALKFFLVFGLAFEIPVATFLLIWSGMVGADELAAKRRYIIVGNFFAAMFLAPPDAFSMLMLAVPMCLMFEAGLIAGRMVQGRQRAA